ncbi:FliA/WhiG family RNA polymerase sigma factor [Nocardioides sp. YIM 152315]|uniref:sigma-70 family RNA polymerase sigma factor n=1 Tax=Nocardioides sp. YIM 152315 TaxID=3031760 RepID=UPI0023DAACC6|nr:FliA/WhiG family RNA polymerase sigma factor [Nocardioides sp. YIM 152315]MDF1605954.1 FliA/WhiG family RNA polymerase sigma factor [Nocardioides sp. YIM 152315]
MTPYNDVPPGSEALILVHVPLVGHIVRETMARVPSYVDRDDLSSAGLAALVQAAHSYDPDRGVPFNRYATTRIRGAILDELRSIDWASRSVRRRARELDATRSQLATALGRPATTAEVAQASGLSTDEIQANDDDVARAQVLSLHASEDEGLGNSLVSGSPTPEASFEHRERLTYLTEAIAELPERLRHVVEQYFLAERPMAEIAATLGVTESRVSQLRAEALVLLRDALNHELEPDLVPEATRPGGAAARRREAYFAAVAARHAHGIRGYASPSGAVNAS